MLIAYLADHPGAIAKLAAWFSQEWPEYYDVQGTAVAAHDLRACCHRDALPIGLVAVENDVVWGVATLKNSSVATHTHLRPWLTSLLVAPARRGQGFGRLLVEAIEAEAQRLGFPALYAATVSASGLFERLEWQRLERGQHHSQPVTIFCRTLRSKPVPASA